MATQKKPNDPSDAALSAIEEALGLEALSEPAKGEVAKAEGAKGAAPKADKGKANPDPNDAPRLPRVDDLDIFKDTDGVPPAGTSRPEPSLAAEPGARPSAGKPAKPAPAKRPDPEEARPPLAPVAAANDDHRASVSELLEPLRRGGSSLPYLVAVLLSAAWLVGAWLILGRPDGLLLDATGALRAGNEGTQIVAALAVLAPVLFFFTMAALQRRSREMRVTASVMAQVAARLAEPEVAGGEAVFTLGQAVRREVSSIGDGIERAITRAAELETLVHGEVNALERSYADNAFKMQALVTELSSQREAIMATAARISQTIEAANQGFTADIEKAGGSIAGAIEEAGNRVSFLIGGKQDELVTALDRNAQHAAETFALRTRELTEGIDTVALRASEALRNASETTLTEWRETTDAQAARLAASAQDAAHNLQSVVDTSLQRLTETTTGSTATIESAGQKLSADVKEVADLVTGALTENGRTILDTMGSRSVEITEAMRQASGDFIGAMEARGEETTRRIAETGDALALSIAARGNEVVERLAQGSAALESAMETNVRAIAESLDGGTARLGSLFETHGTTLATTLTSALTSYEETLRTQSEALEQSLVERGMSLAELIANRVQQANEAFSIAGESLGALIADRTREASAGLKDEIDALAAHLIQHTGDATEQAATAGRDIVQAVAAQGTRVNEALAANAMKLAETVSDRTAGLSDRFGEFEKIFTDRANHLENTVMVQGEALGERLAQQTGAVAGNLESLLGRIESGLDTRAKTVSDQLALRTLEFSRVINENSQSLLAALKERSDAFAREVVAPLSAQVDHLDTKTATAVANLGDRLDQSAEAITLRAGEVERNLQGLSELVGRNLLDGASVLAERLDEGNAKLTETFETRGRSLIAHLETTNEAMAERVVTSLNNLNEAITSGSESSLSSIVQANETLRGEVAGLLGRLAEANSLLGTIVGTAAKSLGEVEGRMSERVRGLEATLAAILSASREGSEALATKVEAIRAASGEVLQTSDTLNRELGSRTESLQSLAETLSASQREVTRLLADRQGAFESMAEKLSGKVEDIDSMLRSFSGLVEDQLAQATAKAREAGALLAESTEQATGAIGQNYEKIRLESGKERERTAAALRAAYEQANSEMGSLFQRAIDGFAATAGDLRQVSAEMMRELEETRRAVAASGLEIPQEVRSASQNLKRVVADQVRALGELQSIVSRSGTGLDVAEPRRNEPDPPRFPSRTSASDFAPPPRTNPAPSRPVAPPATPSGRGSGSWLSGLLERASEDEPAPPARGGRTPDAQSAARIESLDSLSVDIARMIDHDAAIDLWDRYRRGERNVFTRRLYTLQGQEAYDDIRRRYRRDAEFKKTVDAYIGQFERLLSEVAGDDRDSMVAKTYLTSDTGKVYTMLAHAAGRFD